MTSPAVPASAPLVAIVDYGMGNRRSVEKALARVGARTSITADHDVLRDVASAGTPLFGSCMGMQLLFESSEEHGGAEGLGVLAGEVRRLRAPGLNLPHIGWNAVRWTRPSPISHGLPDPSFLYHVHTYAPHPTHPDVVLGTADYGEEFATVVGAGTVWGAQSHPEKSSAHGLALLGNFVAQCAAVPA